ncbi:MAG TPA: hypothetical protein VGQ83_38155 [Polyangia bacterium]
MRGLGALLAVALVAGCSGAQRPGPRVAVLPVDAVGLPPGAAADLRRELLDACGPGAPGAAATDAAVREVAPASQPGCAAEPGCVRRVGQRLGVPQVLGLSVASLARTHVLRARLVSTDETVAEREVSETVVGEARLLAEAVRGLPGRLFPARAPRWYTRPWVWLGAAALAGVAISATVVLTRASGPRPDVTVPLP